MLNSYLSKSLFFCFVLLALPEIQIAQDVFTKIVPDQKTLDEALSYVDKADYFMLDVDALKAKLNTEGTIEISVPFGNRVKTIQFTKTNILAPSYRLYTSSGKTLNTARKYAFYHGKVLEETDSKVTLTMSEDEVYISIYDEDGGYEISKQEDFYAGYYNQDRKAEIDLLWDCQVIEDENLKWDHKQGNRSDVTPDCVTIFLEIDHRMYQKKNSDISSTEAWAMNLFTQVAILYMEHNVPINISGMQIWDTSDPYTSATNTSGALNLFRSAVHSNPNFNGRLAHLLSGRSLGGGIAYLNSLCSTSTNVAVSANLSGGSTPYPSYSWNVMVVAHEIGHNMGSRHTQSCSWNGNNTAIDGCGDIEGSCPDPGNPPNGVGGTIMSYCHLTSSGINFNNGFGPQPGALIEDRFNTALCETGENCAYVTPFNDVCNRAKALPVLNYCVNGYFTNYETTPSNDGGSMSCGETGNENDIWYRFEHVDADTIHMEVQATQNISDLVVEVYSGVCNNLVSLDCGFSVNGEAVTFTFHDPTMLGETLYIRIVEKGSDEEGEFSICIYSEDLPCQSQLDTLLNIYEEWDGNNWTQNNGWAEGISEGKCDYCNWHGITCDYKGNIVEIDLSNNNLVGKIMEDLTAFVHLTTLSLNDNLLFDTIPNNWDSLGFLRLLDLRNNQLSGTIPSSFGSMARINSIHLDYNNLGNDIPVGLGYNFSLRTFTASNNMLEGCFSAGISNFCSKDSINLADNPDLPYGGDVTLLCEEGWGTDWDLDGYCNEVEDCDDFDVMVNPGMDEITCDAIDNNCNGSIDEGSDFGPNIWIGPDTLGVFDDPANWSLGHVPLICENVEIGTNGDVIDLILLGNTQGGGTQGGIDGGGSFSLQIRDLNIGPNATVHLAESYNLAILGNGRIENQGTMIVNGYINIRDQNNTNNTALLNSGTISVIGFGGININEIGDIGIHNTASGIIDLGGYSYMESYGSEVAKNAMLNEGVFRLLGNLYIYGTYTEEEILNKPSASIELQTGSLLNVY